MVNMKNNKKEFLFNLQKKMQDSEFLGDIAGLIRPEENYNPEEAFNAINKTFIERM